MSPTGGIGFGQYIPGKSLLHHLDPRTKLALLSTLVISLFVTPVWWTFLVAGIALLVVITLSRISVRYIFHSLKTIWIVVAVTYLFHLLFTQDGPLWWSVGPLRFYQGGIVEGAIWTLRIILVAVGAMLITMTTPPLMLTQGLARLFRPLKRLKLPVDELALITSSALSFIPLLSREVDQLIQAQRSRGAPFDRGSLWVRAKAYTAVLIPLFISCVERAEAMAVAMEVRGYRGEEGRTQFRQLRLQPADYITLFLLASYLFILIGWSLI